MICDIWSRRSGRSLCISAAAERVVVRLRLGADQDRVDIWDDAGGSPTGLASRARGDGESNQAACCTAFGRRGSSKRRRSFLANGRKKYFAIIACDSITGDLNVAQSASLPRLTLRARRSGRTWGACFASDALWARRSLLPSTSLWTSWTRRSGRTLRTGWPLWTSRALRTGRSCGALAPFTSDQQDGGSATKTLSLGNTGAAKNCCILTAMN
jgi:hypothetical protein